jgi:hypothetical protein
MNFLLNLYTKVNTYHLLSLLSLQCKTTFNMLLLLEPRSFEWGWGSPQVEKKITYFL